MEVRLGNIIDLAKEGQYDAIAHGCNCFCAFGAGLALQIAKHFPAAAAADQKSRRGDYSKMGSLTSVSVDVPQRKLRIFNLYTQYFWGHPRPPEDSREVRYRAIENSLRMMKEAIEPEAVVALPKIGAGLAGGEWDVIEKLIERTIPSAHIVIFH